MKGESSTSSASATVMEGKEAEAVERVKAAMAVAAMEGKGAAAMTEAAEIVPVS